MDYAWCSLEGDDSVSIIADEALSPVISSLFFVVIQTVREMKHECGAQHKEQWK